MQRILLIDPDEDHAQELAGNLRAARYLVERFAASTEALDRIEQRTVEFAAVIIALRRDHGESWTTLKQFATRNLHLPIVCIARVYAGPKLRLDIEHLGARLVYER